MAIVQLPDASRLMLLLDDGMDEKGNPKTVTKSFNNVKPDATDEALFAVANSLVPLQTRAVVAIKRDDQAELIDNGE